MAKNILIVEDDEFLRGLLAKQLSSQGFAISEAINGREGEEKIKDLKPDLVLLDLLLPDVDGFEFLSKVKQDAAISSIPVIILSNLGQKEDIDKGLKLGASDFLIKAQFTPDEIVDKVKKALK